MMKYIFFIFITLMANAQIIDIEWDVNFTKRLIVKCEEDDTVCRDYFGGSAFIPEEICSNCFSNNMNMSFLFKNIGIYLTRGEEVDKSTFWDTLYFDKNYISMNYKTPYNLVQSYSAIKSKITFRKLCENDFTQEPILFFEKEEGSTLGKPSFVFCGQKVYEVNVFDANLSGSYEDALY